jgi:hypothetical protein
VTHSNIQDFGVGFSVSETIRNVFNGAETLELAARGNIGSSQRFSKSQNNFFNVSRVWVRFKTEFLGFSCRSVLKNYSKKYDSVNVNHWVFKAAKYWFG